MGLKTAPTLSDFSITFPVRDTYKPILKAGIVIENVRGMMLAMGQEFGKVFDTKRSIIVERMFPLVSQYMEMVEQQNQQPITGIILHTLNKVIHAGIPEALVYMSLCGGHGSVEQRTHLLLSDETSSPFVGAVAHDFPDAPQALVSSTALAGAEELTPLTESYTAKPLGPNEQVPSRIEQPIKGKTTWPRGTKVVYPVPVLDEEKLRHPDAKDITLHFVTQDVRDRLSGTDLFFLRFLRDEEAVRATAV